jgi:hypothetical protein
MGPCVRAHSEPMNIGSNTPPHLTPEPAGSSGNYTTTLDTTPPHFTLGSHSPFSFATVCISLCVPMCIFFFFFLAHASLGLMGLYLQFSLYWLPPPASWPVHAREGSLTPILFTSYFYPPMGSRRGQGDMGHIYETPRGAMAICAGVVFLSATS